MTAAPLLVAKAALGCPSYVLLMLTKGDLMHITPSPHHQILYVQVKQIFK